MKLFSTPITADSVQNFGAEWKLHLLQRFLALELALGLYLWLRDLWQGQPAWISADAVILGVVGLLLLRRFRNLHTLLTAALFYCAIGLLGWTAWDGRNAMGPSLCFCVLPGLMATLLEGPLFGGLVSAAMLGTMAFLWKHYPSVDQMSRLRFQNLGLAIIFATAVAYGLDRSFRSLQEAWVRRGQALQDLEAQRRGLALALFGDLQPLLKELKASLDLPSPAQRETFSGLAQALVRRLKDARSLAQLGGDSEPDPRLISGDIRPVLTRWVLRTLLLVLGILLLRSYWILQIWQLVAVTEGMLLALALGLRFKPRLISPGFVGFCIQLACLVLASLAFISWGGRADAPTLALLNCLILAACLLNGYAVMAGSFLWSAAILAWAGLSGMDSRTGVLLLWNLAALQLAVLVVCISVLALRRDYLSRLRAQAEVLSAAFNQRRRLAGTLFHDVNNQVTALSPVFDLYEPAEAQAHGRRLLARAQALLNVSQEFLLGQAQVAAQDLKPIAVDGIFKDMEELFSAQARAKGQSLAWTSPPGLELLALPAIVTESVLGNLVSNALKFSPPGAVIQMEAKAVEDEVLLLVRDQGAGISAAVMQGLKTDSPLRSTPGTVGEKGQGYGLYLVKEHLERQNGRLELASGPQGGTEARAWLPAVKELSVV